MTWLNRNRDHGREPGDRRSDRAAGGRAVYTPSASTISRIEKRPSDSRGHRSRRWTRACGAGRVAIEADVRAAFRDRRQGAWPPERARHNAGFLERQTRVERHRPPPGSHECFATMSPAPSLRARSSTYGCLPLCGGGGAIVKCRRRAAQLGAPGEYVDYAASKAALDTLTIGLRRRCREVSSEQASAPASSTPTFMRAAEIPARRSARPDASMKRGGLAIEFARAIVAVVGRRRPIRPARSSTCRASDSRLIRSTSIGAVRAQRRAITSIRVIAE